VGERGEVMSRMRPDVPLQVFIHLGERKGAKIGGGGIKHDRGKEVGVGTLRQTSGRVAGGVNNHQHGQGAGGDGREPLPGSGAAGWAQRRRFRRAKQAAGDLRRGTTGRP
jgi:hypothetical protein